MNCGQGSFLAPVCIAIFVSLAIMATALGAGGPVEILFLLPIGIFASWFFFRHPACATLILITFIPLDMFAVLPGHENTKLSLIKFIAPLALAGTLFQRGRYEHKGADRIDIMFCLFAVYTAILFPFSPYKPAAVQFLIKIGSMLLLYYLIVFWGDRDPKFMRNLTVVLIGSTAVSSLFAFFSIYREGNPFSAFQDDALVRVTGASGISPNDYAYVLFLPLALAGGVFLSRLPRNYRLLGLISACCIGSSLLYTYSRSAILTAFLSFLFIAGFLSKKFDARLYLALPVILILACLLMPESVQERMMTLFSNLIGEHQEVSISRRGNYLRVGSAILAEHPFLGGGLGSFPLYHADPAFQKVPILYGVQRMPHNVYLQVATETGIVGLMFFLAPLFLLLHRLKTSLDAMGPFSASLLYAAALLALLSSLFMGFFLHLLFNKTFWLTLAYCRVLVRNNADPSCYRTFEHRW